MEQSPRFREVLQLGRLTIAHGKSMAQKSVAVDAARKILDSDDSINIFEVAHSVDYIDMDNGIKHSKIEWIKYALGVIFLPVLICGYLIVRGIFPTRKLRLYAKYGMRVYQLDYGFKYGKGKQIDFVIDDDVIKSDEVIFWRWTSSGQVVRGTVPSRAFLTFFAYSRPIAVF